jgi:hypothetical protein
LEVIISQAGIIDFIGTHPQIPTMFVANVGTAIPIANTIELLGAAVAAHGVPLQTVASGNTVDFNIQYASAAASSIAGNAGVASFNSAFFTVDSNGFVSISGGSILESFTVDASTPPGTNPVVPNGSGIVTVTGGQVAAGTTTNVIRTNSLAANTYTIQIQRSQAVASSTIGDNGVSHFNSTYFTVDANGFVSLNGSAVGETITGNTGGALSPTAGNWNILGTSTAAGTTPVQTSGSASTLTVQVQKAQAIATTNATNVGLAAFDSARFAVDANGFVTLLGTGAGETITGNTGGALSPTGGNWNIVGTGSTTTSGSASTLTIQLTGLTNHALQVGAGTATLTQLGAGTTGQVLQTNTGADPTWSTATYPSTTTINQILYSSSANTVAGITAGANGVLISSSSNVPSWLADGTTGQILTATTGSPPSWANPATSGTVTSVSVVSANGFAGTVATATTTPAITLTTTQTGLLSGNGTAITGTAITQYNVITGGASNAPNSVAPSATSGVPLISQGSSSQPVFGTAVVAGGGTGNTSQTAYSLVCGGTTTTGAFQAVADVATGSVLVSGGTSALPAFSATPTITSVTFGSGTALNTYVQGTWTPTLKFGGASVGLTYTTQKGEYNQIGNIVFINADIAINAVGSSTGTVTIVGTGLPNCSQTNSGVINIPVHQMTTASSGATVISFTTADSSNTFTGIINSAATGGNATMTTSNTTFSNGTFFRMAGFYFTS